MKETNKEYLSVHWCFPWFFDNEKDKDKLGKSLLNRGTVLCVLEDENMEWSIGQVFYHYAETQIADSTRFLTVLCPKILQAAVFLITVYLGMIGRQQIALSKGIHFFPRGGVTLLVLLLEKL